MGGLDEDAVTGALREAQRERRRAARREGAKAQARERARGQTKLGTKMVERALGLGMAGDRSEFEAERQANRIEMARIRGLIKNALDQTGMGLPPEEAQRIIDQIVPQGPAPGAVSESSASAVPGAGTVDPATGEQLISRIVELRSQGLSQDEAERQALTEFGLE